MTRFIHLRNHTEYSLLEGANRLKKLPDICTEQDMPALAITDTNNLFGALEFSETLAAKGIQPIIGAEMSFKYEDDPEDRFAKGNPLVLLAKNETGYLNLLKLTSFFYLSSKARRVPLTIEILRAHHEGLICLTGGANGPLGALVQDRKTKEAEALALEFQEIFGDRLYMEIERHGDREDDPHNPRTEAETATEDAFLNIAYAHDIPLVATNNCLYPKAEMYEPHDAMLCIGEGTYVDQAGARRRVTNQHYFKSAGEMATLFADLPEAIENTVEIAKRCAFRARKHAPILPKFADDEVEELRRQAKEGLKKRLEVIPHAASVEDYDKRLDYELGIIEGMGFPGYFLIVADFIKWAKDRDIPVGPGRGSGAGSLVAYALTITDLDPLRFTLLFERFLNPERVSMPDFDIDFCMDRREEVIQYVQEKYGRDRVAQIITFGQLMSKAAIRDVGRVLQMPYGQVDKLSKLIPVEGVKPVPIGKALTDEPRLVEEKRKEPVVARMLDIAEKIEGLMRNASTHAAGVVIGDRPLDELVPLYQDIRADMPATQFNMKWVEQAGLVKFDFLGLKTLTVVKYAVDMLKKRGVNLDIDHIPLDDPKTFELYASAQTVGVFQVESAGMRDALRQMKPTTIEDIVALVALYRPGPMENIPTYCRVKNGLEKRASIHPLIDHILEETQGIIVYQEQVMEIAQVMAGYTLGGADLLRRAMGKKIKEAMDAERPKFIEGSQKNGVTREKAEEVFALLEKFANYGFNKSHAAAYALVSYQTAYLKANYPAEFMAAIMNGDLHLTDKLAVFKQELDRMKIPVEHVSVNTSRARFDVEDDKVLYALGALKNVSPDGMEMIVAARHENGRFKSLYDFARRVDLKRIGKRSLEMMARAGALDCVDRNRQKVLNNLDTLVNYSAACHDEKNSSQVSLFGDSGDDLPEPRFKLCDDWMPSARLAEEHRAVGFYLSGHPLDAYQGLLKRKNILPLDHIAERAEREAFSALIAGTVTKRQERTSAKGNRFAFIEISDPSGLFEVMCFSDILEANRERLEAGQNVVMGIEVSKLGDSLRATLRSVQDIDFIGEAANDRAAEVFISTEEGVDAVANLIDRLSQDRAIKTRGDLRLILPQEGHKGEVMLKLGRPVPMNPEILAAFKSLPGVADVREI